MLKNGTTWALDVSVVCPGTARFVSAGADTVAGKAAAGYQQTKEDGYADQPNFVPFIMETGGRIGNAGRKFIDTLTGVLCAAASAPVAASGRLSAVELAPQAQERRPSARCRSCVDQTPAGVHSFMLAKIVEEIHTPDWRSSSG